MPNPTSSAVHVDQPLTDVSLAFIQDASQFVAMQAFPNISVGKQSDKYFTYNRGDFSRDQAKKRAPGTESAGGGFRLNTDTYYCDVWAIHQDIDDQTMSNADAAISPEIDAAEWVAEQLMVRIESEFASTYMAGGVWDNDFDGTASSPTSVEKIHWSDQTSGNPIEDVREAKGTILGNTGKEPNTLILGHEVYEALLDHPDIVDRIKYSGGVGNGNPARVNEQTLAQLFDLDRIIVSRAVKNSAEEGATDSIGFIVGKDALLVHSAPRPGLKTPTAGYTFTWNDYLGQRNGMGMATSRLRMDALRSTRIEGEIALDMKVVSTALGYFWDGIVA